MPVLALLVSAAALGVAVPAVPARAPLALSPSKGDPRSSFTRGTPAPLALSLSKGDPDRDEDDLDLDLDRDDDGDLLRGDGSWAEDPDEPDGE